jgi:hypothetical protein
VLSIIFDHGDAKARHPIGVFIMEEIQQEVSAHADNSDDPVDDICVEPVLWINDENALDSGDLCEIFDALAEITRLLNDYSPGETKFAKKWITGELTCDRDSALSTAFASLCRELRALPLSR